jgi:hypothetical protein
MRRKLGLLLIWLPAAWAWYGILSFNERAYKLAWQIDERIPLIRSREESDVPAILRSMTGELSSYHRSLTFSTVLLMLVGGTLLAFPSTDEKGKISSPQS